MNNIIVDYAGKYLREYESKRYSFFARALRPIENIFSLISPPDAEEFSDVSFYQEDIDWDEYRKHARAAILRIGQGAWKDTKFERNYSEGKRVGCLLGGYWFYDGRTSPQQQAQIIIAAMQDKTFELELYVDWERSYSGGHEGLKNVVALMQLLDAAGLKVKDIGIYTGYYWFVENSNTLKNASQYLYLKTRPLYLAWYAAASMVKIPAPWADYTLWQYGTPVVNWGQKTKEIDMNKSRYTRIEFEKRYINGGDTLPPVEPPPTGGSTMYRGKTSEPAKVWSVIGGTQVTTIPTNTTVEGDAPSGGYARITSPTQYAGYTKTMWLTGYIQVITPPPPPPPVDPPPIPVVSPVIFASMDFDLATKRMTTTRRRADGTSDIDNDPIE